MLSCQRSHFTLPAGAHYLNCAYMAPLAAAVRAAGIEGIDRRMAPHLIRPEDFFDDSHHLRCLFSRVVNVPDPNRVAIVPSVSYGLANVARNVPAARGDNIVILEEQFPSNVYVWRRLCAARGLELRTIEAPPWDARGRALEWNIRLLSSIDRRTALVSVPHVHWADGTLFDLERVGERARDCSALLVVDGTQSVGALPFDVQRIRPDALVCAGYKWLLGPYSMGLAYYGPAFDHGTPIEENWITRRGSEAFAELIHYRDEYQSAALRYDVGQRSNFVFWGGLGGVRQPFVNNTEWPTIAEDYADTLHRARQLSCEFFTQGHTEGFGFIDKMNRLLQGDQPNPFYAPQECREGLEQRERDFQAQLARERAEAGH